MRWIVVIGALLTTLVLASAEGMDDQYIEIYNLIQEGDGLAANQPREAVVKYTQAQVLLQRLEKGSPTWNPTVVKFRLNYLAQKLAALTGSGVAPAPVAVPAATAASQSPSVAPARGTETNAEAEALRGKVRDLEADKSLLESKLREALAAVPAAVDPSEINRANDKVRELQKENELLKTRLEQDRKTKPVPVESPAVEQLVRSLDEANRKLAVETERARALAGTNQLLQARYEKAAQNPAENAELATLRRSLEEANQQLAQQRQTAARTALEQAELRGRVEQLQAASDRSAALAAENQLIKKQLEEARRQQAATPNDDLARQLTQARAQIAMLQSDQETLRAERARLEQQVRSQSDTSTRAKESPKQTARIKELEKERDDFERQLKASNKELAARKSRVSAERIAQLEKDLNAARARVAVLEARTVPYSAEELALFHKPDPSLSGGATKQAAEKASPAVTRMVAEAKRDAAAGQVDQASATLRKATQEPGPNVGALSALAATQIAQDHLDEAEKSLQQALAASPNDPASLSLMGTLKYRQGKTDESVEVLSRAASADPKNAEVQNYLGLSLSQKGLRAPAEAALRRAVLLQPNYGSAHYNLAVIYLSQQPPMVELARWHYQKSLASGQKPNPDFEKMLESRSSGK